MCFVSVIKIVEQTSEVKDFTISCSIFLWKLKILSLQQLSSFSIAAQHAFWEFGFVKLDLNETEANSSPQKCTLNENPVLETNRKNAKKIQMCFLNFMLRS